MLPPQQKGSFMSKLMSDGAKPDDQGAGGNSNFMNYQRLGKGVNNMVSKPVAFGLGPRQQLGGSKFGNSGSMQETGDFGNRLPDSMVRNDSYGAGGYMA